MKIATSCPASGYFGGLLLCCLKSPDFCLCTDVALTLVKVLLHVNTVKNWPLKAQYAQTEIFRILFCFTWSFVPGRLWGSRRAMQRAQSQTLPTHPSPVCSQQPHNKSVTIPVANQKGIFCSANDSSKGNTKHINEGTVHNEGSSLEFSPGQCF